MAHPLNRHDCVLAPVVAADVGVTRELGRRGVVMDTDHVGVVLEEVAGLLERVGDAGASRLEPVGEAVVQALRRAEVNGNCCPKRGDQEHSDE